MKAIGYKEIVPFIRGDSSWEETDCLLKLNTRHYAKRQLTWMRREDDICWVDSLQSNAYNELRNFFTQGA
jgi:tRNA dimethylallyltransferase